MNNILYYKFNLVKTVIFSSLSKLNNINSNKSEIYIISLLHITHIGMYVYVFNFKLN